MGFLARVGVRTRRFGQEIWANVRLSVCGNGGGGGGGGGGKR